MTSPASPSPADEFGARSRAWDWRRALSPTGNRGDAIFRALLFASALLMLAVVAALGLWAWFVPTELKSEV